MLLAPGRLGLEYHDPTSHLPQYAVGLCICERGSWRGLYSFGTRATKYLCAVVSWTMDKGWDQFSFVWLPVCFYISCWAVFLSERMQGGSSLPPLSHSNLKSVRKAWESPCVKQFCWMVFTRLFAWLVNGLDGWIHTLRRSRLCVYFRLMLQ